GPGSSASGSTSSAQSENRATAGRSRRGCGASRDRAYRVLRRKGVKADAIDDVGEMPDVSREPDFDADERRQLQRSLDRLPYVQREVLLLRFVEDLSYEQIAAAVGCELGTVRSRL